MSAESTPRLTTEVMTEVTTEVTTSAGGAFDIISNERYAERGYPHAEWKWLRENSPIHYVDQGVLNPFWAVTKYADLVELSRQPKRFRNGPRLAVFPGFDPPAEAEREVRHLLVMDPPEHGAMRRLASGRFTPRGIGPFVADVERIARDLLDEMYCGGEEVDADFVEVFSARLPLEVLCAMLGVPREDWSLLFDWTNRLVGSADPEFREDGVSQEETAMRARLQLFGYFGKMVEARRANPSDDITSLLANAKLEGPDGKAGELAPAELLGYLFLLVIAGNETTRNATSGGLLALIEHPDELAKLKADPALIKPAVEEIVRWTSPVIQFCRTPDEDVELHGVQIPAGGNLTLFYPSANRDADAFDDPDHFRVDRRPNHHVGFGIGEHFCLGANLARLELRVAFKELVARLEHIELTGKVDRLYSSFVGGIKRMPIRYRLGLG